MRAARAIADPPPPQDTLAALDSIGPVPQYRTPNLASPQNKRYSRPFNDLSTPLQSSVYRSDSPTDNEYSAAQIRANVPRIISPPPDARPNGSYPGNAAKTPRTPGPWKSPTTQAPQIGSPHSRRNNTPQGYDKGIMGFPTVKNVRLSGCRYARG